MSNQIIASNSIETAIINGDLSKLTPEQRVNHYLAVCKSTGLNPLTKPFDYINLSGKLVLYAKKDCTDQLRKNNHVSIVKLERETISGVYVVTAYAEDNQGRSDSAIGAVHIETLKGDALANAMMKAETKAKRRVTLSICGLGWLDETEIETIPDANRVVVNDTGEIMDSKPVQAVSQVKGNGHKTERPLTPDQLADMMVRKAASHGSHKASDAQRKLFTILMDNVFLGDDDKRHTVQQFLFGFASSKEIDDAMILAGLDWLNPTQDSGGTYSPDPMAIKEAIAVYDASLVLEGQGTLI